MPGGSRRRITDEESTLWRAAEFVPVRVVVVIAEGIRARNKLIVSAPGNNFAVPDGSSFVTAM
jgi:hypothetical protein